MKNIIFIILILSITQGALAGGIDLSKLNEGDRVSGNLLGYGKNFIATVEKIERNEKNEITKIVISRKNQGSKRALEISFTDLRKFDKYFSPAVKPAIPPKPASPFISAKPAIPPKPDKLAAKNLSRSEVIEFNKLENNDVVAIDIEEDGKIKRKNGLLQKNRNSTSDEYYVMVPSTDVPLKVIRVKSSGIHPVDISSIKKNGKIAIGAYSREIDLNSLEGSSFLGISHAQPIGKNNHFNRIFIGKEQAQDLLNDDGFLHRKARYIPYTHSAVKPYLDFTPGASYVTSGVVRKKVSIKTKDGFEFEKDESHMVGQGSEGVIYELKNIGNKIPRKQYVIKEYNKNGLVRKNYREYLDYQLLNMAGFPQSQTILGSSFLIKEKIQGMTLEEYLNGDSVNITKNSALLEFFNRAMMSGIKIKDFDPENLMWKDDVGQWVIIDPAYFSEDMMKQALKEKNVHALSKEIGEYYVGKFGYFIHHNYKNKLLQKTLGKFLADPDQLKEAKEKGLDRPHLMDADELTEFYKDHKVIDKSQQIQNIYETAMKNPPFTTNAVASKAASQSGLSSISNKIDRIQMALSHVLSDVQDKMRSGGTEVSDDPVKTQNLKSGGAGAPENGGAAATAASANQ